MVWPQPAPPVIGCQDDHGPIVDAKSSEPIEQFLDDRKRTSSLSRVTQPRRGLGTDEGAIRVHDVRWMRERHMDD